MQTVNQPEQKPVQFHLSTDDFAKLNGVKGQSVRARVCRTNSYFGVIPRRLKNGRLIWPEIQVAA